MFFLIGLLLTCMINRGATEAEGSLNTLNQSSNPLIDGIVSSGEWVGAASITIPYGNLRIKSDNLYLYLLIDVFADTQDDHTDDTFAIYLDLNDNGRIDPNIDMVYKREFSHLLVSRYLNTSQLSQGKISVRSQVGVGFGSSARISYDYPKYRSPHRIWEIALPLKELKVNSGDTIGLGLKIYSKNPPIHYGDIFNFSRLVRGQLLREARRFAIIDELDWMETADLLQESKEYNRSRAIALLKLPGGEWCTSFLVAEDILWTATHCLNESATSSKNIKAIFNWEKGVPKEERETFLCDEILASWPEPGKNWGTNCWDVTLLRCKPGPINAINPQDPGSRWGNLKLCDTKIYEKDPVYIVHQNECWGASGNCETRKQLADPDANPNKKISFGLVADPYFSNHLLTHDADTLGGSSGAPIFDPQSGYVIAYHRGYLKGENLNAATSIEEIRPVLEKSGIWSQLFHCRK